MVSVPFSAYTRGRRRVVGAAPQGREEHSFEDPGATKIGLAFIRESDPRQMGGYSPETQKRDITAAAASVGVHIPAAHFLIVAKRSVRLQRTPEYQQALALIRSGAIDAVFVWAFSRWGRKASHRLSVLDEMDRLGVAFYSVTQGPDKPGIERNLHALIDEQYSRDLSRWSRPNREAAARSGVHCGRTMIGMRRVYPQWDGKGKRPPGLLVPDEELRWVIRDEIYGRYAEGGWSCRALAEDLNSRPDVPPPTPGRQWTQDRINYILHNPTYYGGVPHNFICTGEYERAAPGTAFIADGKHEPLVPKELWDRVQAMCERNATHIGVARPRAEADLASGLLCCHECCAPMVTVRRKSDPGRRGQYECVARREGRPGPAGIPCRATSYRIDLAHNALLAQIARLQGAPWTAEVDQRLRGESGAQAQEAARVAQELARAEQDLKEHASGVAVLVSGGLDPEVLEAFKAQGHALAARVRALRTRQTELGQRRSHVPSLRRVHALLASCDLATHLAQMRGALARPDLEAEARERLRALVLEVVASAHLVERQPPVQTSWLRLAVTWTPPVQELLVAGALTLAPDVPSPPADLRVVRARERRRRWREKQKSLRSNVEGGS
jgi:DNA invertase Pin-like site-specific DNA recombinase